jgi:hypothetical protein
MTIRSYLRLLCAMRVSVIFCLTELDRISVLVLCSVSSSTAPRFLIHVNNDFLIFTSERTFLDKFGSLDAVLDRLFISQVRLARECLV